VVQVEEEKKEDDDDTLVQRKPQRNTAQNTVHAALDDAGEEDDPLLNRAVDVSYFEDVAGGRLDEILVVHPKDKLGRKKTNHEARRARRMTICYFFMHVCGSVREETGL